MSRGCYLALCARPVQFEKANPVNCVFFDEANKQVFAVRSGGATGVVVKGLEDKNPISFRMEDKGEVKCIKFSLGNKILAVQRTSKSVDFLNFIPDSPQLEYTQECKTKNANILGFCWTSSTEIVFITDQGIEFYQVLPEKRSLKLVKNQNINVNWYMYCPESSVILLSTTVLGNVLQPFYFKGGTMSKLSKFEIELPAAPKSSKLSLSERDIAMATIYGQLYVLYLRHHSRTSNSAGAEVVLYHLPRESSCKKMHILKLNRTGKFALNVVDNLVVVHHQDTETSVIFDIKLKGEFDGTITLHQLVLPARSIQPYQIPVAGPASVTNQSPVPCKLYSSSWIVFQPDIIISASEGYLWNLEVKLEPVVNLLPDKGKLMDFLLQRKECKMVILSVCSQMLSEPDRGTLAVIATVFDKLNHEYKKYLEAEQSYTMVVETGQSRGNPPLKRPVRTQAVIDQSDMYTHVLSVFIEKKEAPHKFTIAVLMEYIRSLNQFQIAVQHYLYELVIKTLVQHNLFYMLHQFLQYHVLSDSKPLACLLLSLESIYPPAHQLSLDMLKALQRLSTANDEIVEVLLSKHQVLAALRFIRGVGGHDSISARKFLDAAKQADDNMLFYTIFRFFEQRNQRLRGNPNFTPAADNRFAPFLLGEPCRRHSTASMDPAQLHTAIVDVLNTSRTLVQYMLNQDLRTEASKRRIRQRGDDSDEDVDTELSQTAGPGALEILMVMGQILSIERRFWARETSTDWWDRIVLQVWDDSQWLRNFRMRKGTFMELCDLLAPALKRHNTKMRAALTVEKRVAIALWKLATPDSYRSVGNQFGVGKSTVGAAVMQVAKAITKLLLRKVVTLGNVQAIVDGFAAMGFPNCGGAIDGTHIPILAPQHQGTQYVNRKGYFSMVLQALVDHKGRFTNIHAGWPGRVHDARVFRSTTLFKRLQQGTYFPDQKITVGDVEMPVVILGDPAYPLMPWLMKPYTGSLDSGQDLFNYRLSKCRMVVECAFGRLKARWRTLLTRSDLSQTNVPYVIAACCILHNLCESKGETFMAGWEAEANHLAADYAQPDTREIRRAHQEAVRIREALKTSFINGQGTV